MLSKVQFLVKNKNLSKFCQKYKFVSKNAFFFVKNRQFSTVPKLSAERPSLACNHFASG